MALERQSCDTSSEIQTMPGFSAPSSVGRRYWGLVGRQTRLLWRPHHRRWWMRWEEDHRELSPSRSWPAGSKPWSTCQSNGSWRDKVTLRWMLNEVLLSSSLPEPCRLQTRHLEPSSQLNVLAARWRQYIEQSLNRPKSRTLTSMIQHRTAR